MLLYLKALIVLNKQYGQISTACEHSISGKSYQENSINETHYIYFIVIKMSNSLMII